MNKVYSICFIMFFVTNIYSIHNKKKNYLTTIGINLKILVIVFTNKFQVLIVPNY